MKNNRWKMIVLFLAALVLAACGKTESTPQQTQLTASADASADVVEVQQDDETHDGQAQSPLTGEWIDADIAANRPLAIMIDNTKSGLPQYGIGQADVIYEVPVEGSYTRLMAIFQDYENIERISSVRSCRHYFVYFALGYDAIYTHYGQAKYALDLLAKSYVDNVNAMDGTVNSLAFERDSSRKAPYNAYTSGSGLTKAIESLGYRTTHEDGYEAPFSFAEEEENVTLSDGIDAGYVKPGYFVNKSWFEYDEESGLYLRYEFGSPQVDAATGEQLTAKNIIIQYCQWNDLGDSHGYINIDTMSGGDGYYITEGKAVKITWKKDSETSATKYFNENGEEITFNRGKTWISVVRTTYKDRTVIAASGDDQE
jgi:hypothetical protein